MKKRKKICFVSSSGGHWEELLCLTCLANKYDSFYVTEEGGQAKDFLVENLYTVNQINRNEKYFSFHLLKLFIRAFRIISIEKPNVVITTGALVAFPFCFWIKIFGGKIIYIESFARVHNKSLTGKLIYPFADLFIVQWETLLNLYPKAKYCGGIF